MSELTVGERPRRHSYRVQSGNPLGLDFRQLWPYRELLYFLAARDIKVRYKQTSLGVAWAILQPFLTMVVFSIFFGRLGGFSGEGAPYPLFVYAGLLPWTYFASSLGASSGSVVANSALVTKVFFPRLLIPLASIFVPIVDFLMSSVVLAGMFAFYGRAPHWGIVAAPAFLLMALLSAFGAGLWFSALNVRYRDVPFAIPFLVQIWMFVSPVIYAVTIVPARWRWVLSLNPMTGVISGFRWSLLGGQAPQYSVLGVSLAAGLVLTVTGLRYFHRVEQRFADVI